MGEIILNLRTLTPLWTGGVEVGKMDRIHESGILGSLRWWYEAIVRGLGGDVCDPTSDRPADHCPRSKEQQTKEGKKEYCDVCELFGATGNVRAFRLQTGEGVAIFDGSTRDILIPSGRIHIDRQRGERAGGWYIMADSVMTNAISLRFIPLRHVNKFSTLRLLLSVIERNASITAKIASGYGTVQFYENGKLLKIGTDALSSLPTDAQLARNFKLPDIRDFFFGKLQFNQPANSDWWKQVKSIDLAWTGTVTDESHNPLLTKSLPKVRKELEQLIASNCIPLAPSVRNWLRFEWQGRLNNGEKNYLFGTTNTICPDCYSDTRPDKQDRERKLFCFTCKKSFPKERGIRATSSKINVTHAYKVVSNTWELRIWGWLPCKSPNGIRLNRDEFLSDLHMTLSNTTIWNDNNIPAPRMIAWHSLDCNNRNGRAYLEELLGLN